MDFRVGDGHRFDEEVRHVALHDVDLFEMALAVEPNQLRRQIRAAGRPDEQQHRAVGLVRVDHQPDFVAGSVLAFFGDEFDVVEAKLLPVEAVAAHDEEVATFDDASLAVFVLSRSQRGVSQNLVAQPILPRLRGLHLLASVAFFVRVELPSLHRLLDRLALLVVSDRVQRHLPFALDRFLIDGLSTELGEDVVAGAVVAAIDPRENSERFASDQHVAGADNCAARLIDDLSRD